MSPARPAKSVDPAGEFLADVPDYFFHLLFQAQRRHEAVFETALKPLGLNLTGWRALLMVKRMEPCTMNELARMSMIERTTLTRTVDHLVAGGLVDRCTPPEDRRQVRLSMTLAGRDAYDDVMSVMMVINRQALAGLDEDRLRDMARGLSTAVANLIEDPVLADSVLTFSNPDPLADSASTDT